MDAGSLMQDIFKIAKRLTGLKLFNHTFPFNNTEMQMMKEIIRVKEEGGKIISSHLAKELGVTRSAVSQMVNKLERDDIVRRVPDEKDKKIAYIELSESARGIYEDIKQKMTDVMDEVIQTLGERKVRDFLDSAEEFVGAFDAAVEKYEHLALPALENLRRRGAKA